VFLTVKGFLKASGLAANPKPETRAAGFIRFKEISTALEMPSDYRKRRRSPA
jgi:hypothetical protein